MKNKSRFTGLRCLLLFNVLVLTGCFEKRPDGMPDLVPCTISVIQQGARLADANVALYPLDESKWTASGGSDASGNAEIHTWGTYRGVPVGKYKVTVTKVDVEKVETRPSGSGRGKSPNSYHLVDLKLGEKDTTPLEIEVVKGTKRYSVDAGAPVRELISPR